MLTHPPLPGKGSLTWFGKAEFWTPRLATTGLATTAVAGEELTPSCSSLG